MRICTDVCSSPSPTSQAVPFLPSPPQAWLLVSLGDSPRGWFKRGQGKGSECTALHRCCGRRGTSSPPGFVPHCRLLALTLLSDYPQLWRNVEVGVWVNQTRVTNTKYVFWPKEPGLCPQLIQELKPRTVFICWKSKQRWW